MPEGEHKLAALLSAQKERLLLALALALLAWSAYVAFGPRETLEEFLKGYPDEARVAPVSVAAPGAGGQVYAGDARRYWDPTRRYVFGRRATVRVFVPIQLEVPRLAPDPAPGPLPVPGPRLEHTGGLPRWKQ